MTEKEIEGVIVVPMKKIPDERGTIYHMMRVDDPHFQGFGEVYGSSAYPGVIKAWHVHKTMTLNYAVPTGMIKLVLFDMRDDSRTKGNLLELFIGDENYSRVTIPPGVANGYKNIGTKPCLVINCATEPHSPTEMTRIDPFSPQIPYRWDLIHR